MLAQAEGEPEFRDVGEGESPHSNSGLASQYFVPIDQWTKAVQPIIYEATWEFQGCVSGFLVSK